MAIKKTIRKIVAWLIIPSMLFSSILCYSPFLPEAVAVPLEHNSSHIIPFLENLRSQNIAQQEPSDPNSENEIRDNISPKQTNLLNANIDQTNLSQEEIRKIVNDRLQFQRKLDQTINLSGDEEEIKIDRFIVKYKSENQKEETVNKVKGNLKDRRFTKNKKFDFYLTSEKMKKEDFKALLKQKQADDNIEYIQPDYQMKVASNDHPQTGEQQQPAAKTELPKQQDNSAAVKPNQTQHNNQAPLLSIITFDGLKITLIYNENLNSSSVPAKKDFTVTTKDEKNVSIGNIEITNKKLVITLTAPLATGETVIVSYTIGTSPLQDLAGNPIEGFNNKTIANLSEPVDITAPVLQTATINAVQLELNFSAEIKRDSLPAKENFSLSLNTKPVPHAVQSLAITGKKVILTLTLPVAACDVVQLSYIPGNSPLMDSDGNKVSPIDLLQVNNLTSIAANDPYFSEQWALQSNQMNTTTYAAISVGTQINTTTNAAISVGIQVNTTTNAAISVGNQMNTTTNAAISVGIDAAQAWTKSEGDGVVIAVIDTGIDITHEDLMDNIWTNTKESDDNGVDDDGNSYIDDIHGWNFADDTNTVHNTTDSTDEWHGTHIAGIIAATMGNQKGIVGVAPKAKIMPLQVFKNGTAYTSDIISAIHYAKENGAQVVNCSWGTTSENIALKEAIAESGLLFICAAGNSNKDIDANTVYPASLIGDNIISVASINKTGNLSWFSNYGLNSVDVAAPGEKIISTTPGNTYSYSGGTSQAAAFVTGEVALILSKYPKASLSEIRTRIINSSDKLSSLTEKVAGGGKINCASALTDPLTTNNIVIQISTDQLQNTGTITPDNGEYYLYLWDEWNNLGNLQTARMNFGAVTFNNKIYCIGGSNNENCLNSVEIYDPITGTSTLASNLNTARYVLGVATTGGKIYAIGGYNGGCLNTVEEYDPATNIWTTKTNMPTPRSFLGAAAVNGIIYAIGGSNSSGNNLNTVEAYDPTTNTWSTKANMLIARSALGIVAVNNKIYAIGGSANWHAMNTVEEYDPSTDTWTTKASMPASKQVLGVAAINEKIYAIGGYNDGSLNDVYEYDADANVWARKANLAVPRYGLGAAAANGKIYAIGGYNSDYLSTVIVCGLPIALQDLSAITITSTAITLIWSVVSNAIGYEIEVDGTVINNGTNTMYVHSGLLPNITHTYRYRAKNATSVSDWSTLLTVATASSAQSNMGTTTPNNIHAGDIFNLVITGTYLTTPTRTVTITYNSGDAQLLDLYGFTSALDTMTSGPIPGTNITINQNTAGMIKFTVNLSILNGKSWSGVLNMIKFRANVSSPSISYSAQ